MSEQYGELLRVLDNTPCKALIARMDLGPDRCQPCSAEWLCRDCRPKRDAAAAIRALQARVAELEREARIYMEQVRQLRAEAEMAKAQSRADKEALAYFESIVCFNQRRALEGGANVPEVSPEKVASVMRDRDLWSARCESAARLLGESREELADWIDGARSESLFRATMLTIDGIDDWQKEVRSGH